MFTATVVTLTGITFSVLVGQLRALRFHDGWRSVILRGDQLDVIFLTAFFVLDRGPDFWIQSGDGLSFIKHRRDLNL